jgi:RNA polymerase sigma factor (sigma-70 family)
VTAAAGPGPGASGDAARGGWDDFAPLYDEHHERLYRVALLLCHGSETMAQDAVAETFLHIYPAWSEGRVDNFFPYARQTLVRQVMGQYGTPQAAAQSAGAQPDASIADAASTFQLLEQLPPGQRTAVVLRYFEDLSYDQIASTMGVPVGTAKAEVSSGLQRMRTLMGEG